MLIIRPCMASCMARPRRSCRPWRPWRRPPARPLGLPRPLRGHLRLARPRPVRRRHLLRRPCPACRPRQVCHPSLARLLRRHLTRLRRLLHPHHLRQLLLQTLFLSVCSRAVSVALSRRNSVLMALSRGLLLVILMVLLILLLSPLLIRMLYASLIGARLWNWNFRLF
jgi:hypothetical protein